MRHARQGRMNAARRGVAARGIGGEQAHREAAQAHARVAEELAASLLEVVFKKWIHGHSLIHLPSPGPSLRGPGGELTHYPQASWTRPGAWGFGFSVARHRLVKVEQEVGDHRVGGELGLREPLARLRLADADCLLRGVNVVRVACEVALQRLLDEARLRRG